MNSSQFTPKTTPKTISSSLTFIHIKTKSMAVKNGIGYSPLTDKVYLGKQNTEKNLWVGAKKDITNDFLAVASEYFEENTIRDIRCSNGASNLFINIKNDKASIEKVIKNLTKRLNKTNEQTN